MNSEAMERAREAEAQLTDDERFSLLISVMGTNAVLTDKDPRIPDGVPMSAGYTPGIPRLGIPGLLMTDASLGVTNPGYREGDTATALPASIALGASFNPVLARRSGQLIGREARSRGLNVLLAGGLNLHRDPRNGRNFEYLSEDPWLTGVLGAESVEGIQGEQVISTVKHFSLNCNETNRHWLDAVIDPAAHRESDLLAFEIAIERARPGSVMTGYNKINGTYAGGNDGLLQGILKGAWGFPGWVMSDWGATPSWGFALQGQDQESGVQIDVMMWGQESFTAPLRAAFESGEFPKQRLSEMVQRILYAIFDVGIDRWEGTPDVDPSAHAAVALETARQGIVLLKNDGVLPLEVPSTAVGRFKIAVIGGHAQLGVPAGCGSSAVTPPGGYAEIHLIGGPGIMGSMRNLYLLPSSPLAELQKLLPDAEIEYDPGMNPREAALLARRSDVAIVFGIRVEGEGYDNADLTLPWGQDTVIDAVAGANSNTVVVLETGNPVAMPWLPNVRAVLAAWYPGQCGGQAIAEILAGVTNPSGKLPLTFPKDLDQTPRPVLPGLGTPWGTPTTVIYNEGSDVGYRWFAKAGKKPLFPFGHGLSYTRFGYGNLTVQDRGGVRAEVTVTNEGPRSGADVPQLYLLEDPAGPRMRLLGFERVDLEPGESRTVELTADPRLLASYNTGRGQWHIAAGNYRLALGPSAGDCSLEADVYLAESWFGR
ncbi:beta-glucosidase [Arthrobacter sp. AL08]|uniref:beta-glucosidase family protein n=1 Tax=unclassified Arthrobacter TaxID=235627 RepID=UPI00249B3319|nr:MULTISPECIES: beta-glucosidase [unclassified Arthrobacter]MDI3241934.1 beta-glucosidase [Arthrobacter sp. AL05]MDI3278126.1 beta-glucosidase [Arthrobacter sp. AL08]